MKIQFDKRGKQLRMLQTIANHIWSYGCQPSLRELAEMFGWSSPGYVQFLLKDLRKQGIVSYDNHARSVRFCWQEYVTDSTLSRNVGHSSGFDTGKGSGAKKPQRRRRKLGAVSKSR